MGEHVLYMFDFDEVCKAFVSIIILTTTLAICSCSTDADQRELGSLHC